MEIPAQIVADVRRPVLAGSRTGDEFILTDGFRLKQIVKIIKRAKSGDQPSDDSSAGGDDA